jgi:hypothetical protein
MKSLMINGHDVLKQSRVCIIIRSINKIKGKNSSDINHLIKCSQNGGITCDILPYVVKYN